MSAKIYSFLILLMIAAAATAGFLYYRSLRQQEILRRMVSRLEADSRAAEVLVTAVEDIPATNAHRTTIKFLEYDSEGRPLQPQYYTFSGDMIQFQSLVIRFRDIHLRQQDALRGKSAYLFWKVFMLDGPETQEFVITPVNEIPAGYKIPGVQSRFERRLWRRFWEYALDPEQADAAGVKSAQIEAPGTRFRPGLLYTIRIEHDGGLRIDAEPLPGILRGETVPR
ncbi:MAG: hypothetical protein GF333_01205 [Candidatus Omnitrophica bacterium]|nr:hypothetical protein [Candidatus Omnitrophota bacterium]